MKEIWKDIKNFEGKYQISNLGNVRSLYDQNQFKKTYRIRYLKLGQRQGYSIIQLTDGCKIKRSSYQIHRLVAEAFIPNPENKPFINHIDENRKITMSIILNGVRKKKTLIIQNIKCMDKKEILLANLEKNI